MKTRTEKFAIAPKVCCEYLTPGKKYQITEWHGENAFSATSDCGMHIFTRINGSTHLNGGNWIIVSEPESTLKFKVGQLVKVKGINRKFRYVKKNIVRDIETGQVRSVCFSKMKAVKSFSLIQFLIKLIK